MEGRLAVHENAGLAQLVSELRRALKEGAEIGRIRTLADNLRQAVAEERQGRLCALADFENYRALAGLTA
jgi:hypothetical protein